MSRIAAGQESPAGKARGATLTRQEVRIVLGLGVVIALVAVGVAFLRTGREQAVPTATPPDRPRQLVEFSLIDRSGRPVTKADLEGKFAVVTFIFTGCSLSCGAVNDRMEELQRLLADQPDVKLVSLTVDPRTDTPSVLARFANQYHADTNRWLFLTGDKAEVYHLIETSFIAKSPELEGLIPGGFVGTDRIMLVDPRGNVCASFNGLQSTVTGAVVAEIEKLRKHMRP